METYRTDRHEIVKPSKFIELPNGYEVVSNDGTVKMSLHHTTLMDGNMESGFYYTKMWIKEEHNWVEVNNTQMYRTKEEFLNTIKTAEGFSQAISEFNIQNNSEQ